MVLTTCTEIWDQLLKLDLATGLLLLEPKLKKLGKTGVLLKPKLKKLGKLWALAETGTGVFLLKLPTGLVLLKLELGVFTKLFKWLVVHWSIYTNPNFGQDVIKLPQLPTYLPTYLLTRSPIWGNV
jgi:hypothetical protein